MAGRTSGPTKPRKTRIKRGRRYVGETYTFADGRKCYFLYRNLWQLHRAAEPDLSSAVRSKVAGWAIAESDLIEMNAKGFLYAGVIVRETGDRYLTELSRFRGDRSSMVEIGKMNRIRCRLLPLSEFRHSAGAVKI